MSHNSCKTDPLAPKFISHMCCLMVRCRCVENLKKIGQKLLKLFSNDVKMLTELRNHGMTDRLKTVYPPKTSFCGGYNKTSFCGGYNDT